jgi:hypothetical protein
MGYFQQGNETRHRRSAVEEHSDKDEEYDLEPFDSLEAAEDGQAHANPLRVPRVAVEPRAPRRSYLDRLPAYQPPGDRRTSRRMITVSAATRLRASLVFRGPKPVLQGWDLACLLRLTDRART